MTKEFRPLKPSEIECRIGTFKEGKGMSLLLYKDARVDMKLLDEVYGPTNWKREHKVIGTPIAVVETDKFNNSKTVIKGQYFSCIVSVWDDEKKCWISKEDTGNESNTDEIKGLYSDSFKRACVNFGIGRELYTAPFIWIASSKGYTKYEKFKVTEIKYNSKREISALEIVDSRGNVAFTYGVIKKGSVAPQTEHLQQPSNKVSEEQIKKIVDMALACKVSESKLKTDIEKTFKCDMRDMTIEQAKRVYEGYKAKYEVMKEKIAENMSSVAPKADYEK